MGPRILIAGATGYIGSSVVRELRRRQYEVVALIRDNACRPNAAEVSASLEGVTQEHVDFADPEALRAAARRHRCTTVVSCIASRTGVAADAEAVDYRANRNLLKAALESATERFVLLSAICVQKPQLAFQFAKLKFEQELENSGLPHSIVRPTAYFKSLAGQVNRVRASKPFLVFGSGEETACKPIGEADLARFIADCSEPAGARGILPIGGPGPALTPKDQGRLLQELAGRPIRFRHVPVGLFSAVLGLLTPLAGISRAAAEKAELARIGRYYATESMLVWDPDSRRYDAAATPSFGTETLHDFYARVLKSGMTGQSLGDQALFRNDGGIEN